MGLMDWFKGEKSNVTQIDDDFSVAVRSLEGEYISKSKSVPKAKAYEEPLVGSMNMNPDYKEAPSINNTHNLLEALKNFSRKNIILNSIINTRVSQVSLFCFPAKQNDKGFGYEVRLKDPSKVPNEHQKKMIDKIEKFLEFTGEDTTDFTRDNFRNFVKKITRDRLIYDKMNFELVYNKEGKLHHFNAVDASTIYVKVDEEGKEVKGKNANKYVQVLETRKPVAEWKAKEMAWEVFNPRTDVTVGRYGYPELEQAIQHIQYHENTELFNSRYFSQGGTTRGLIHLKTGQQQSQSALSSFRRDWTSMFSGVNGAWQIPVITAEDVKFVNMTQTSKDMEFEKWLNYLINSICSVFSIDPSEINFPNRGGATGNSGNTLNESSSEEKFRNSKNKGLEPLLKFIEDAINKYIVSQFGDQYLFTFVGGDTRTEREILETIKLKVEAGYTFNEIREEYFGLPETEGGDIIADGTHVQRLGQLMQKEMMQQRMQEEGKQNGVSTDPSQVSDKPTRIKDSQSVGRDGQVKGDTNSNSAPQGGKGEDRPSNDDWKK